MVPVRVLAYLHYCPIPVLARYIASTGIIWCPYRYWHLCILVQYQYQHSPLRVLALHGACTGIGIYAFWSSTSIGMVHYRYRHLMVPVPVMAFMHFGPLPVLAQYITGTGIKWCQYQYWHICTFVQSQCWYGLLLVLALNGDCKSIGIYAFWSSTSIGMVHYRYWHLMVPVRVLAYLHFCPIPVLVWSITSTGIKW